MWRRSCGLAGAQDWGAFAKLLAIVDCIDVMVFTLSSPAPAQPVVSICGAGGNRLSMHRSSAVNPLTRTAALKPQQLIVAPVGRAFFRRCAVLSGSAAYVFARDEGFHASSCCFRVRSQRELEEDCRGGKD